MKIGSLMAHKIIFSSFILVISLFSTISLPNTNYLMSVSNVLMVGDEIIEFEVSIKSVDDSFILTSYQCSFLFNLEIGKENGLSFNYVDSTSQLTNQPTLAVGINDLDGKPKLTFASWPGLDTITKSIVRIGRFRFQSGASFANVEPNITWNFEGFITTILTGESFQNITNQTFHNYDFGEQSKFKLGKTSNNHEIPNVYKLFQNYPNPFNPTTKITFSLPKYSQVNLTVYNLLGQEIAILVDDRIDAGTHSVDFVGEGLPSGMYFCKLKIENKFLETIKMILLR